MERHDIRKALDENDEVHVNFHDNQVVGVLQTVTESIENGTEIPVSATMKMSNHEPGIIRYEIVTKAPNIE